MVRPPGATAWPGRWLAGITDAILGRLDPDGALAATYHRYDPDPPVMP